MSGQWEVVGKSKKVNVKPKLSKNEKKKFIENAPRIEDILPLAQVKSLYSALDKENKKPAQPSEKDNKTKENEAKKQSQPKKQTEKPKEPPKAPKPKSIESAFSAIDVALVQEHLEKCQTSFSDAPLIWLKELANFLNGKLLVDINDPIFTSRPAEYPLSAVPGPLKQILENVAKDAGGSNVLMFYDLCLTTITNEMSKGAVALGYKIFVQLLAFNDPLLCVSSLAKNAHLRNSYQNRPPIGLSLLWALGKGGVKDLAVGLKVWHEIMVPVLDMKHYTRFVVQYLSTILSTHSAAPLAVGLTNEFFLQLLDTINTPRPGLPKDLSQELLAQSKKVRAVMFNSDKRNMRLTSLFPQLLKRLHPSQPATLRREVSECLVLCLQTDNQCYSTWRQGYTKSLVQTAELLEHIKSTWKESSQKLGVKNLKNLINTFQVTNDELGKGKKKEDGLQHSAAVCKVLQDKMTVTRSFPWLLSSVLLVVVTSGLIAFDINTHGTFEKSTTGIFLKDSGALQYAHDISDRALVYGAHGYKWAELNIPQYYDAAAAYSGPYFKLAYDLGLVTRNMASVAYNATRDYVVLKTPVVVQTIDSYAPGLVSTVQEHSLNMWTATKNFAVNYYSISSEYLKKQVFVGQLSPENLHKVTLDAINTTQNYAVQYYAWFYDKVNTYSKVQ